MGIEIIIDFDVSPCYKLIARPKGRKRLIVPAEKAGDAIHLAFAAAYRVQFLCTWNFKHLANALILQRLKNLNEKHGIFTPQVCTPEELLGE